MDVFDNHHNKHNPSTISFTRVLWLNDKYILPILSVSSLATTGNICLVLEKEHYMKLHSGLPDKCLFFIVFTCWKVSVCFTNRKGIMLTH